jgi:hypothetical protein
MTKSIKLSFLEWTNVVMAVVEALGEVRVTGILERALGVARATELIRDKKGPALSKDDNRAIVRELYKEPITGSTRDEKINWAIAVGRKAFDSDERLQEVLQFVLRRIQEDEDAGGTIDKAPPAPTPAPAPSPGTPPKGADNNFLWKPVGESTKKLVVLTPWSISVEPRGVMTINGETGNYTGLHNGARGHYRFSKPGSAYGNNIRVEYKWRDRTYVWTVPNGGSRYTSGVPKPEGGTAPAPVSPTPAPAPGKPSLPVNPAPKTKLMRSKFSAKKKDYDGTWRISWPEECTPLIRNVKGSYCMIGDRKATYRGMDKDLGANRIKFSIKQGFTYGKVLHTLHDADGKIVAWIDTGPTNGSYLSSDNPPNTAPSLSPTPTPSPANQFEYLPDASGITLRIPYKHWQLHIFSRRKHVTLYGPDKTGKDVYRLNMTGQQLKDASIKAGDDGSLLVFVNTNTELTGKAKNAGWRIMNPLVAVRGDGSRLKPGEDK